MIVADTGGILALLNRDDEHHERVAALFRARQRECVLPWAILPEVDYMASTRLGRHVATAFCQDVAEGLFRVDWSGSRDASRASELIARYADLEIGLVDAVVMAQAERHRATTIVTTDARHFRAVHLELPSPPALVPLDPA